LFENIKETCPVIAAKVPQSGLPAQIAVSALVINVTLAGSTDIEVWILAYALYYLSR
jgi:hypothetical protein